jgi:hypothetical protein
MTAINVVAHALRSEASASQGDGLVPPTKGIKLIVRVPTSVELPPPMDPGSDGQSWPAFEDHVRAGVAAVCAAEEHGFEGLDRAVTGVKMAYPPVLQSTAFSDHWAKFKLQPVDEADHEKSSSGVLRLSRSPGHASVRAWHLEGRHGRGLWIEGRCGVHVA